MFPTAVCIAVLRCPPPNDEQVVPVVPQSLQRRVLSGAHAMCGHANWETTWKLLRSGCYFPNMAALCQSVVQSCSACAAASSKRGSVATPTRLVSPSRPWSVVQPWTLVPTGVNATIVS